MNTKSSSISDLVSRIERAPNITRLIGLVDMALGGGALAINRVGNRWEVCEDGFAVYQADFSTVRQRLASYVTDAHSYDEAEEIAPATAPQPCQQQADAAAGSVRSEPAVEAEPAPQREAEIEPSFSYTLGRLDRRCRGWERVIRESVSLPMPEDVHRAGDLPGAYAPDRGSEELFGLDAVMQGEENHHRKARGWSFWLHVHNPANGGLATMTPSAARKAVIKDAIRAGRIDLPREILKGAGDIAALVRMLAAIRAGLPIAELLAAGD